MKIQFKNNSFRYVCQFRVVENPSVDLPVAHTSSLLVPLPHHALRQCRCLYEHFSIYKLCERAELTELKQINIIKA